MEKSEFLQLFYKDINPSQHVEEFYNFYQWFEKRLCDNSKDKPINILEIGTFQGGTLRFWNYIINTITGFDTDKVISIDLNDRGKIPELKERYKNNKCMNFIIGDSTSEKSSEELKKILNGDKLDLLFIDGNHEYNYVKFDYNCYSRYVKSGGIIVFHDIVTGAPKRVFEETINNPKNFSSYIIFMADKDPCGIGVIIKK